MSTAAARQNAPRTTFDLSALAREFIAALPVAIFFNAVRQALQSGPARASRSLHTTSR